MPNGMRVASPKFSKSNRKPKRTKHCTIPNFRKIKARELKNKGIYLNQVYMEVETPSKEFKRRKQAKIEENKKRTKKKKEESLRQQCRDKMETG